MNIIFLKGRFTKEPDLLEDKEKNAYIRFDLAVNRPYSEETDFFHCIAFKKKAEAIFQYLQKGSLVFIQGYQKTDIWEGKDGKKNYKNVVIVEKIDFLSSPSLLEKEG
ncbi:single-stranded DNA-binding protein [Fusobacterium necrophorum]|uniref:Single-stranded DNA-binding protein n=1 Tax=Fusobacterium necrophorum TaxID=859 RepID=A0A4V1QXS7_9FUSO|nr:single-stranded DNA-binding protein [Fusobacterium necrophorum]RXZ70696.1 single-stranded DNA-binding protein [Fusobacterium necrophorum]